MIKTNSCEVCKEEVSKYRCPRCLIVYCSLACYKVHKDTETCNPAEKSTTSVDSVPPENDSQSLPLQTNKVVVPDFKLSEDDIGDTVPQERLQCLERSPEVKTLLANPHLRAMMVDLTKTSDHQKAMEQAMQEPIFCDFADACLQVIGEDKK